MDLPETSNYVVRFMLRLADHVGEHFPQYASALRGEIHGKKMTNDRWNRIAAVMASMHALPGMCFVQAEHDARNPVLSAVVIAQKMAAATFHERTTNTLCLELVVYVADEIDARITKPEGTIRVQEE